MKHRPHWIDDIMFAATLSITLLALIAFWMPA
jgi:hypothetical protein